MTRTGAYTRIVLAAALLGMGGAALSAWPAIGGRSSAEAHARSQALVEELGAKLCATDIADESKVRGVIRDWLTARPEGLRVALTIGPDAPHEFTSHGSNDERELRPTANSELSILADGKQAGTVALTLLEPRRFGFGILNVARHAAKSVLVTSLFGLGIRSLRRRRRVQDDRFGGVWSRARARVTQTLDFLSAGVLILDREAHIVFANRILLETLGIGAEQTIGRGIDSLPWCTADASDSLTAESLGATPWLDVLDQPEVVLSSRAAIRDAEGHVRTFKISCLCIQAEGRVHGVLVTLDDITVLEQQRHELRDARDVANKANEAKSAFLANMSHEIRTPINGVMGTLSLLKATPLQPRQRQYVEAAGGSAAVLLQLINDILDFSKIEAGKLELSIIEFDLEQCINSALEIVCPAAAAKGLELVLDARRASGNMLMGDPDRLRQVLINLTANAIKFTSQGEVRVEVRVTNDADHNARVGVEIHDTGVGIPKDRLDRLFKSFSQVDASTNRKYGGTGLGLAICKQLVELMDGSIGVRSTLGKGSTFHFEVKLPKGSSKLGGLALPPRLKDVSLLVLEPNASARAILEDAVRQTGLNASVFESAEALMNALKTPRGNACAVVLGSSKWTDEMTGIAKLALQASPGTKVFGMTVGDVTPDVEQGLASVITSWVKKPFAPASLLSQLDAAMAPREAQIASDETSRFDPSDAINIRILVAEDNPVGQLVTCEFLRSLGLECEVVDRGDRAAELGKSGRFNLIFMDCHLPEMDGFTASRLIRDSERTSGKSPMKIVALTASAMSGDRERCLAAGMDDYITKPVQRATLAKAISEMLKIPLRTQPVEVASASGTSQPPTAGSERADASPQPAAQTTSTPFDVTSLHARCMNQSDLVAQLLDIFEAQTLKDLENLAEAWKLEQTELVRATAHAIAGGALQVGATNLASLARAIENDRAATKDTLEREIADLRLEFDRCAEFISAARAQRLATSAGSHKPKAAH